MMDVQPIDFFTTLQYPIHLNNESTRRIHTERKKGNALTIFDVGANRGEYSIALSGLFPTARIYAFEPSPSTFKLLVNEVLDVSQIDAVNIGFGNENETASLYKENTLPCLGKTPSNHTSR